MAKTRMTPFVMTLLGGLLSAGLAQAQTTARKHQNTALVGLVWWLGNKTGSW